MTFNHRVLAHEHDGDVYFEIHEVYYNKKFKPILHTENPVSVGGESIEEILWVLERMKSCLDKPILWAGDKFPKEYKAKKK